MKTDSMTRAAAAAAAVISLDEWKELGARLLNFQVDRSQQKPVAFGFFSVPVFGGPQLFLGKPL